MNKQTITTTFQYNYDTTMHLCNDVMYNTVGLI